MTMPGPSCACGWRARTYADCNGRQLEDGGAVTCSCQSLSHPALHPSSKELAGQGTYIALAGALVLNNEPDKQTVDWTVDSEQQYPASIHLLTPRETTVAADHELDPEQTTAQPPFLGIPPIPGPQRVSVVQDHATDEHWPLPVAPTIVLPFIPPEWRDATV